MSSRRFGSTTVEVSELERTNYALARKAAREGIILLENDSVLPLPPQNIALYGMGARKTVKGGMGSGAVNERFSISIESGLEAAGYDKGAIRAGRFPSRFMDAVVGRLDSHQEMAEQVLSQGRTRERFESMTLEMVYRRFEEIRSREKDQSSAALKILFTNKLNTGCNDFFLDG